MTEQELIYSIINTANNAEHNNDEPVTENLARNFLRIHRGDSLRKYYKNGQTIDDEVFQKQTLSLIKQGDLFIAKLPKIIRFENAYGFYIERYGTAVSIGTSQSFNLNKTNPFNSNFIQAKTEGNELILRLPESIEGLDQLGENYFIIKDFMDSVYQQELFNYNYPGSAKPVKIDFDFFAVLYNPSDCPSYDWENDTFPFPAERLPELEQQVLAREFGIMAQSKKDEIQNSRADEVRYHDNEQVQNS